MWLRLGETMENVLHRYSKYMELHISPLLQCLSMVNLDCRGHGLCILIPKSSSETHSSVFPVFLSQEYFSLHYQLTREEFGLPHKELPLRVLILVSIRAQ